MKQVSWSPSPWILGILFHVANLTTIKTVFLEAKLWSSRTAFPFGRWWFSSCTFIIGVRLLCYVWYSDISRYTILVIMYYKLWSSCNRCCNSECKWSPYDEVALIIENIQSLPGLLSWHSFLIFLVFCIAELKNTLSFFLLHNDYFLGSVSVCKEIRRCINWYIIYCSETVKIEPLNS